MAFLQRLAPNGQRWSEYCGAFPPASDIDGRLVGQWGELMMSAVVFELTNPGWEEMPGYQEGAGGQVIEFCEQLGYGDFIPLLESSEEQMKEELAGAEGDEYAFLRQRCKNGRTWKEYCSITEPCLDGKGFVSGAWGECLTAAVIYEHQNPEWSRLPMFMEDGPAGQVINFMMACGHNVYEEAINSTEQATHQAVEGGGRVPVFEDIYQAVVGTHPAEHVNEAPPEMTGRKKALLVGINYFGTSAELRGCINDVQEWKSILEEQYGFQERDMTILTDDQDDPRKRPTLHNMRNGVRWLVSGAAPGDVLFFQYSGHGTQQQSRNNNEADGMDEALCPCDYSESGVFVDDELFDTLVTPLPSGVKLTIILDCCHSGTAVDLPFIWEEPDHWEEVGGTSYTAGDVQMFSGCEDDQCSMDVSRRGKANGAMTTAMTEAIREDPGRQYPELLNRLREILAERGYEQFPRLTSSQRFDPRAKTFSLCEGAIPNKNPMLGCTGPPQRHAQRPGTGLEELFL
eukprot:TRINITY_DN1490_c0_g2_i1.p1 TRINITY_DN1490_c0_g2~~TRINITY_DN1490_c0_g2_i1.p1  ORF type:complete len:531 (+),score=122.68 TRINITY_DN1490_c0_g2_i1:52-1593(+)